ncbi:MAG: helix-turn-helix transcriptional regulator [Pseudomonadota bacterium]
MPDALILAAFLSAVTLGQALLSGSVLVSRVWDRRVYLPLAVFFFALAVSEMSAVLDTPSLQGLPHAVSHLAGGASLPADMLLLPMFWFYVRAMTSEREEVWSWRDLAHLVPAVGGLGIFALLLVTPDADRIALFDTGRDRASTLQTTLFVSIIGLYVIWLSQWFFYALAILKRLIGYRGRLKDLFASTEHLELGWIGWIGVLILIDWAWVAAVFALEVFTDITPVEEPWLSLLDLALVWTLSIWGLRQTPGLATEIAAAEDAAKAESRYEKSALSDEQIARLADKIKAAMREDQLYRDPDLSLSMLAKHISARPNYVSQTLNAKLGATFFDYVNAWRVKDAQAQLSSGSDTVLAIAFAAGFNTRSSFYTAFKRHVGSTPSAWRKTRACEKAPAE